MLSECSGGIRAYFFVGTRSIIAYRSSGSEPETRGARCRQHTDSDPDEHEQACDEYRIQNGILPFAGKGDYLFHDFDYFDYTFCNRAQKGTSSRPCLHRLFLTTLSCRRRGRRQLRHFDDTAALTNEHTIYSDEVAPAKTANCYTLHTGFAQSFQHGFGSFEMFEAAVTLGSGIVIYVYHIFTALVLGISKPAGYTSGTRNFPEVLCVHSRNSGINTARICA